MSDNESEEESPSNKNRVAQTQRMRKATKVGE